MVYIAASGHVAGQPLYDTPSDLDGFQTRAESDDEDVYEDIRRDKFVNLQKTSLMECTFDRKFRKWIPLREIHDDQTLLHQIPYINQLVIMKTHGGNTNRTTANHHHNTPYKTAQKYKHPRPSFHKKHPNAHNRPHRDTHKNV